MERTLLEEFDLLIQYCYKHGQFDVPWIFEKMSNAVREKIVSQQYLQNEYEE